MRPRLNRRIRSAVRALMLITGLAALAACEQSGLGTTRGSGDTVNIALLVPSGSPDGNVAFIAQNLTNSAKLAASELQGVTVDLRVYDTAGSATQAADVARRAVNEGAEVIVGPLYAGSANAVGNAVAGQGISVLSFSNNTAIAGGNVFVMGSTFDNTARRLIGFAQSRGLSRVMVVSGQREAEQVGRDAIVRAAQSFGVQVAETRSFEMSQEGVSAAMPGIADAAKASGADAIFLTSDTDSALPFVLQLLPENGLAPGDIQYVGLTRWDIPASALSLPGVEGSWFAIPDTGAASQFANKYSAAYGSPPHAIAGLGYDGIAAIGALAKSGKAPSAANLTQSSGFAGASGAFRFLSSGGNERALAIATVENQSVRVIDSAPRRFGSAGF